MMTAAQRPIPATVTHAEMLAGWMRDPAFRAEHERLEREEGPTLDANAKALFEAEPTNPPAAEQTDRKTSIDKHD